MRLRPYQREAVAAVYEFLRQRDDNPCVVIPTAGGKTPILATICRDAVQAWNGRVLVLAHVKELLEQAADKLRAIAPDLPVGLYSVGLKRRDMGYAVTVAGIQSIYKRGCDFDPFDLVIVDEAHLIPPDGEGMYRQFLQDAKTVNPHLRIIGLTATPFRMKSGSICGKPGPGADSILNEICYEVGIRELIAQGFLCPLKTKAGITKADFRGLHVRGGEDIPREVENLMDEDRLVESACAEIIELTRDRNAVLIFTSGVGHGQHIAQTLEEKHSVECGFVCGETLPFKRDETLKRFCSGHSGGGGLKYLANVNVLTTGFDAPNIDCVVLLRPTLSPGLYYQMVGRGFRLHPGKTDCLVLDYGGNVLRHGPVDAVLGQAKGKGNTSGEAPARECPDCQALIHAAYTVCPECGHAFPLPDKEKHDAAASTDGILTGQTTETRYPVLETIYTVHTKRGAPPDAPRTLRVDYRVTFNSWKSEWICLEHSGYARNKAASWWTRRSREAIPDTIEEAVELADAGALAEPSAITVIKKAGEKYERIVEWELGVIPPRLDGSEEREGNELPVVVIPEDEIPF